MKIKLFPTCNKNLFFINKMFLESEISIPIYLLNMTSFTVYGDQMFEAYLLSKKNFDTNTIFNFFNVNQNDELVIRPFYPTEINFSPLNPNLLKENSISNYWQKLSNENKAIILILILFIIIFIIIGIVHHFSITKSKSNFQNSNLEFVEFY